MMATTRSGRIPLDKRSFAEAVDAWRTDGWVLLEGLIPASEIDAATDDLWELYPRPEAFHAEPPTAASAVLARDSRRLFPDGAAPPAGRAFRNEQFLGLAEFPFPGSGRLNRLFVHPELVRFARAALGDDDIRVYQLGLWAKYAGVTNYEQPLHTDRNHALVPPRMEPGWWHLEGFLYLSDVDEGCGATRLVAVGDAGGQRGGGRPLTAEEASALYGVERPAPGPRGSYLAYRPDVFHRGVDLTTAGSSRFVANISFRLGQQDWVGYYNVQPRSVLGDFSRFVASCSPDELSLFGVPRPGHPYWTAELVEIMAERYPGLDVDLYRQALPPEPTTR